MYNLYKQKTPNRPKITFNLNDMTAKKNQFFFNIAREGEDIKMRISRTVSTLNLEI